MHVLLLLRYIIDYFLLIFVLLVPLIPYVLELKNMFLLFLISLQKSDIVFLYLYGSLNITIFVFNLSYFFGGQSPPCPEMSPLLAPKGYLSGQGQSFVLLFCLTFCAYEVTEVTPLEACPLCPSVTVVTPLVACPLLLLSFF